MLSPASAAPDVRVRSAKRSASVEVSDARRVLMGEMLPRGAPSRVWSVCDQFPSLSIGFLFSSGIFVLHPIADTVFVLEYRKIFIYLCFLSSFLSFLPLPTLSFVNYT